MPSVYDCKKPIDFSFDYHPYTFIVIGRTTLYCILHPISTLIFFFKRNLLNRAFFGTIGKRKEYWHDRATPYPNYSGVV